MSAPGGVTVKRDATELSISDRSIEALSGAAVRISEAALLWSERNPYLFIVVVVACLIAFGMWLRERSRNVPRKKQYRQARRRAKIKNAQPGEGE